MSTAPVIADSVLAAEAAGPESESFPVLWIMPPRQRPLVRAYYRFARLADHIADHPTQPTAAKIPLLEGMACVFSAPHGTPGKGAAQQISAALRDRLLERQIPLTVASDLLHAFLADASAPARIETWGQLQDYCQWSAVPVGRFLLALHGEQSTQAIQSADALCAALQVLNHLQGLGEDWKGLGRCYLPLDWLHAAGGAITDLGSHQETPAVRQAISKALEETGVLLERAAPLPSLVSNRFLAAQSAACLSVATALHGHLGRPDVLAHPPKPTRQDWVRAGIATLRRIVQW